MHHKGSITKTEWLSLVYYLNKYACTRVFTKQHRSLHSDIKDLYSPHCFACVLCGSVFRVCGQIIVLWVSSVIIQTAGGENTCM